MERAKIMMKPMPIDEVFQDGVQPAKDLRHRLFDKAMSAAQLAYAECEEFLRQNPKVMGSSPPQAARTAFLSVLTGEE